MKPLEPPLDDRIPSTMTVEEFRYKWKQALDCINVSSGVSKQTLKDALLVIEGLIVERDAYRHRAEAAEAELVELFYK